MWVMTEGGLLVNLDGVESISVSPEGADGWEVDAIMVSRVSGYSLMRVESGGVAKRCVVGIAKCIGVAAKANWDGVLDLRLGTADRELVMKGGENG